MKSLLAIAAAATLLATASCAKQAATDSTPSDKEDVTYTGVLPAADADGIRYTVTFDYDSDNENAGEYDMTQVTIVTDSVAGSQIDANKAETKGRFSIEQATGKKYYKLTPDATETAAYFFVIDSDSTITMVNAELEQSVNPELNYTLTVAK